MKNFKTLQLAKELYVTTKTIKLPRHLKDQYLRACSSISLNLAEGNAKTSIKDKLRFYEIAHGSYRECRTIIELEGIKDMVLEQQLDSLGAHLYKLTRALMKNRAGK